MSGQRISTIEHEQSRSFPLGWQACYFCWQAGAAAGHDGRMIRELARVVPARPGKPVREEAARDQERARRLALRPGTWDRHEAAGMRAGFDAAAAGWEGSRGGYRRPWDAVCSQAHWGNWAVLRPG